MGAADGAFERTRLAFQRHAVGEWTMPPKVYLDSPPNGDFRAMPARGEGFALLKWVTSFPRNSERGLPVVTGALLLDASGHIEHAVHMIDDGDLPRMSQQAVVISGTSAVASISGKRTSAAGSAASITKPAAANNAE